MARILLLVFIVLLLYLLLRGLLRSRTRKPPADAPTAPGGEDMVTCARCGVNLPRSEARTVDGRLVCDANPGCRPSA